MAKNTNNMNNKTQSNSQSNYSAAIAMLREKAETKESTIRCSVVMHPERKDQIRQEINICRTAAQWLEEDSALTATT